MVDLIPSPDTVMQILKRTGAFREGHFVYPNGKHSPHYFQMPLAFRYYDTARVLAVALSRKFRVDRDISSQLPKVVDHQSKLRRYPRRFWCARRAKRGTDLLGGTGRRQAQVSAVHK